MSSAKLKPLVKQAQLFPLFVCAGKPLKEGFTATQAMGNI